MRFQIAYKIIFLMLIPTLCVAEHKIIIIEKSNQDLSKEKMQNAGLSKNEFNQLAMRANNAEIQMKENGYLKGSSPMTKELLLMQKDQFDFKHDRMISESKSFYQHEKKYGYSGMHEHISDIPLSFHLKPFPSELPIQVIGAAPAATTVDGKWTGIGIYFNYPNLGTCHYLVHSYFLNSGGSFINKNLVTNEVNNKVSTYLVIGEENKGFLYKVKWADKNYSLVLECARPDFDKDIKFKLIELASKLDKNLQ